MYKQIVLRYKVYLCLQWIIKKPHLICIYAHLRVFG